MNAGNFLGFKNNTEILISFSGTESTEPINTNTIRALSIGIDGDISFSHDKWNLILIIAFIKLLIYLILLFQTAVNVPKGDLINYQNIDGGDSFKNTLGHHDRIKYSILSVYDDTMIKMETQ